ncbi:MAG: hypothetical protein EBX35_01675 [Planctomycetia bacterium]|nr:hypothetical protein [Planctomycetia bacterium]
MLSASMGSLADSALVEMSGEASPIAVRAGRAAPPLYASSLADAVAPGTLRQAVIQANATPGADTIMLRAGTYRLTLAGADEDAAATGDLDWVTGCSPPAARIWSSRMPPSAVGEPNRVPASPWSTAT